jgi:predicted AAA+ superfamily ATPase
LWYAFMRKVVYQLMQKNNLRKRDLYLKRMIAFQDTEMIKVMTGIRRCGKSSLMKLMAEHLRESGVADDQILEMNFESMRIPDMDARGFYEYVKARICPDKRTYLFFDEVQKVTGWENAVNSFRVDFDCDIYITGSNAYLLSSELSTYLSGRYVEIKVLPLSFREFLDFHGYTLTERKSPAGGVKKRIMDTDGEIYDAKELFDAYTRFGGMPMLADIGLEIDRVTAALDGVYSAAVINDILEREKRKGQRTITDPVLLRKIIMFLADNIGNNTSATSIGNTLVSEGLLEDGKRKTKPAVQTIQVYIKALTEAYFFYEIKRFDIKGKEYLRTLGKYYIVDMGLRNYLLGFREGDSGHILENIIFFELMRQGYDVAIGKIDNQEVDFIATKTDEKKYIQVTETMNAPETRERELAPLRKIRDSYEKIVIALECDLTQTQDGIKIIRVLDFLLEN